MTDFVLLGHQVGETAKFLHPQTEIRSLRTHCPVMIRINCEGGHYDEKICRCDIVQLKMQKHPLRCSSRQCLPRNDTTSIQGEMVASYEIIPIKATHILLLPYCP